MTLDDATRDELVASLLDWFAADQPRIIEYLAPLPRITEQERRLVLRAATNLREPAPVPDEVLATEDELLRREREQRGVVEATALPSLALDERLVLWQGDITRLRADAITNAANPALLGCFAPVHRCIDNAIHTAAGMRLRLACAEVMQRRGRPEPTGTATLTAGYNLPAAHVLHTVGPVVRGRVAAEHERLLASSYASCLQAAADAGLQTVAFCGISTGEYGYPKEQAARVAVETVRRELPHHPTIERVVLDVFSDTDLACYRELLGPTA